MDVFNHIAPSRFSFRLVPISIFISRYYSWSNNLWLYCSRFLDFVLESQFQMVFCLAMQGSKIFKELLLSPFWKESSLMPYHRYNPRFQIYMSLFFVILSNNFRLCCMFFIISLRRGCIWFIGLIFLLVIWKRLMEWLYKILLELLLIFRIWRRHTYLQTL